MVAHLLPKQVVAGSNPVSRSSFYHIVHKQSSPGSAGVLCCWGSAIFRRYPVQAMPNGMAELAEATPPA